jgi:hypothetical protein
VTRGWLLVLGAVLTVPVSGCGGAVVCAAAGCTAPPAQALNVQPQNSTLLVGVNRISIAILNGQATPVTAANVSVDIVGPGGASLGTRPLEDIAPVYGGVPVYVGLADFPSAGQYDYLVKGTNSAGAAISGNAFVNVITKGPELAVGMTVPAVQQKVVTEPGVPLSMVDSGVPPDTWHDVTVAQALAEHRPMVLYFGEPGYCPSKTCGPTVAILKQLYTQYCTRFSFQHIEDDIPPGPAFVQPNALPNNPAFLAFGLRSDPWVFFVNSAGVVADRFEGPITLDELQGAAQGTLAGHVPAVSLTA